MFRPAQADKYWIMIAYILIKNRNLIRLKVAGLHKNRWMKLIRIGLEYYLVIHHANIASIQAPTHVYHVPILIIILIHTKVDVCHNVTLIRFCLFQTLSLKCVLVNVELQDIFKDHIATAVVQEDTILFINNA